MKLSPAIILFAAIHGLGCAAVSVPRATNVCEIEGTSANVYCREGPSRNYASVGSVRPGQSFSVQCMTTDGESIDGESAWGFVPAWDCWLSIRWTDLGCKRTLSTC
ncbi:hypothetical protein QBC39DRAFT_350005 [Podospora conica]|nr:hypothetical protein QBC39DRAFT_350005 [Schizothecium conicum]